MTTYIFDIDGTLADIAHRSHWVRMKPKNWYAFNNAMHLDTANEAIVEICHNLAKVPGNTILVASGRDSAFWNDTVSLLAKLDIPYAKLYMRPLKDNRPDYIVKKEMLDQMRLDGYNPTVAFDDRDQVVKMWRENGIICLQVAEGNF